MNGIPVYPILIPKYHPFPLKSPLPQWLSNCSSCHCLELLPLHRFFTTILYLFLSLRSTTNFCSHFHTTFQRSVSSFFSSAFVLPSPKNYYGEKFPKDIVIILHTVNQTYNLLTECCQLLKARESSVEVCVHLFTYTFKAFEIELVLLSLARFPKFFVYSGKFFYRIQKETTTHQPLPHTESF